MRKTMYGDDLMQDVYVEENEIRLDVKVSFDGHDGTLDLTPVTYEALRALLVDRDADGVRAVFAGDIPVRRTKEEMDEIRRLAREAGFDVKDTGRPSKQVEKWYTETYLPSLTPVGEYNTTGDADMTPAAAPASNRKTAKRS